MSRQLTKVDKVSVCHKENCVHGCMRKNAEVIAKGATTMLLLLGIAA